MIAYPLSLGPAVWLNIKMDSPQLTRVLETLYAPLLWLSNASETIEHALRWYAELFG